MRFSMLALAVFVGLECRRLFARFAFKVVLVRLACPTFALAQI